MKILFIHSDRIVRDDIVWGMLEAGIEVEYYSEKVCFDVVKENEIQDLFKALGDYDCAFSQNFIPTVAEACKRRNIIYGAWVYDCPQVNLYLPEALYDTNFVFVFDKEQVNRLQKKGLKNVFYMPLAANISKVSMINITDSDIQKFKTDISFVGSLYEKEWYETYFAKLSLTAQRDVEHFFEQCSCHWDVYSNIYNFVSEETSNEMVKLMRKEDFEKYSMDPRYSAETLFLPYELARRERIRVLNESAKKHETILYTNDNQTYKEIPNCIIRPPVYEDELFKVYFSSKINLNITMRSIETGIPQRVFDIMAVGGCVLSNNQEEIGELFNIEKEILVFSSIEEMVEKEDFYLKNEKLREKIGIDGYLRVKNDYSCTKAINRIFDVIRKNR